MFIAAIPEIAQVTWICCVHRHQSSQP